MINEINKNIFNIKIIIYLIQTHSINFHTEILLILNYHINYIKKIYLKIRNKIIKTKNFNILIIYYSNNYFLKPL